MIKFWIDSQSAWNLFVFFRYVKLGIIGIRQKTPALFKKKKLRPKGTEEEKLKRRGNQTAPWGTSVINGEPEMLLLHILIMIWKTEFVRSH